MLQMNKIYIIFFFFFCQGLFAQDFSETEISCHDAKIRMSNVNLRKAKQAFPGDANIDVNYYFLDIKIDPNTRQLTGAVRIDYVPILPNLTAVSLDLSNAYEVDSIKDEVGHLSYTHQSSVLKINVQVSTSETKPATLKVYYHGRPPTSNENFSVQFTTHANAPVIWTLSEPYDAPLWWPCVDNPADKADSCDVWITLPSFYTAVSQGILEELKRNEDGTNTAKWKHRYPISQYLISIAASNYVLQKQEFKHSETKSMDVLNYLYPETAVNPAFKPLFESTLDMLSVFSEAYGEYPFIKEKYGHAMFGFGGGMEHQTVSSMGGFSTGLISHELAHQWFGDKVTCKTWRDIWVNEGFAEFSSLYYFEKAKGKAEYDGRVAFHMNGAKEATGTVAIENTESVNEIFDFARTYQKGSVVLHMLRGILGDQLFFRSLKEYQTTEHAYGAASIEDFKRIAERVSGEDLTYFFDEWIFGTGYPKYNYSWSQTSTSTLIVNVKHSTSSNTKTFDMPVELKIVYTNGNEKVEKIFVNENDMSFQLDGQTAVISDVIFDPNNWIMKDLAEEPFSSLLSTSEFETFKIYPNPASERLLIAEDAAEKYLIDIVSASGKRIPDIEISGNAINVKYLPSGRYFIRFKDRSKKVFAKSFIKY